MTGGDALDLCRTLLHEYPSMSLGELIGNVFKPTHIRASFANMTGTDAASFLEEVVKEAIILKKGESTIKIGETGIIVTLDGRGGGDIVSSQHYHDWTDENGGFDTKEEWEEYEARLDGLEGLILAQACAGIDITTEDFASSVETALQGICVN